LLKQKQKRDFSAFEYHLLNLEMFFFLEAMQQKKIRSKIKQNIKTNNKWQKLGVKNRVINHIITVYFGKYLQIFQIL